MISYNPFDTVFGPIYGDLFRRPAIGIDTLASLVAIVETEAFFGCAILFTCLGTYYRVSYGILLSVISVILWVIGIEIAYGLPTRLLIQFVVFIFFTLTLEKLERPIVRSRPRYIPRPLPKYATGLMTRWVIYFLKLLSEGEKRSWKWIAPPTFTDAFDFSEGRGLFEKDHVFGYVDREGAVVIEPQFIRAHPFSEGLACVEKEDFQYGYIYKRGVLAFSTPYRCEHPFSGGLARVQVNEKYGYIEKKGKIVTHFFDEAHDFIEGFACVAVKKEYDFISQTGSFLTQQRFEHAESFSDGLALVKDHDDFFFIDKTGSTAVKPAIHCDAVWSFVNGFAEVEVCDKRGFINRRGNLVVEPRFDATRRFSEGLAAVDSVRKDGVFDVHYWGFINTAGKIVIEQQFEDARYFSGGLAPVKINGNWGYIDASGHIAIKPKFSEAFPFRRSTGRICFDFQWGFIDRIGAYVILPQFAVAHDFKEGLACAARSVTPQSLVKKWGYIRLLKAEKE
ncbi:MAG: WG repeat-containing protein [Candidatus Latescibacter sp.]|nr:WG repeat-containing protein [Candidatus Latescibacter sp.]